jgi:hypothetical protein
VNFFKNILLSVLSLSVSAVAFAAYPVRVVTDQADVSFAPADALAQLRALRVKEGISKDTDATLRALPMDLTISTGQGEMKIDLRGLRVSSITLTGGQGDILLQLPDAGAITGKITTKQSAVQIVVPASRAVALKVLKGEQADIVFGKVSRSTGIATELSADLFQGNLYFTERVYSDDALDDLRDAQEDALDKTD